MRLSADEPSRAGYPHDRTAVVHLYLAAAIDYHVPVMEENE